MGRIVMRVNAFLPVTKKPSEVRMGKGKGKIKGYVAPVSKGKILFEIRNVLPNTAVKALLRASVKLPIFTKPILLKDRYE